MSAAPSSMEAPRAYWNPQRSQWELPPGNGNPQLARWNVPAERWEAIEAPSIALTLVISALFGIFGIIPAIVHSNAATRLGQPTGKYWGTFAISMAVNIVLFMALIG